MRQREAGASSTPENEEALLVRGVRRVRHVVEKHGVSFEEGVTVFADPLSLRLLPAFA
jgi:hypothetical protein